MILIAEQRYEYMIRMRKRKQKGWTDRKRK